MASTVEQLRAEEFHAPCVYPLSFDQSLVHVCVHVEPVDQSSQNLSNPSRKAKSTFIQLIHESTSLSHGFVCRANVTAVYHLNRSVSSVPVTRTRSLLYATLSSNRLQFGFRLETRKCLAHEWCLGVAQEGELCGSEPVQLGVTTFVVDIHTMELSCMKATEQVVVCCGFG